MCMKEADDKAYDSLTKLADCIYLMSKENELLIKKASAWDRVLSIANDGTFLTSDMIKIIEEQENA